MIDNKDREILAALQENAMMTSEVLGARVHLSPSQAARRRQRLEAQGTITSYRARLDPAQIGLGVQAFVQVQMGTHTADGAKSFKHLLGAIPQIVNAWTLTGEADYLLRVWCADLSALNTLIHDQLLPHPAVARVQSQIVMEQLKQAAALPV